MTPEELEKQRAASRKAKVLYVLIALFALLLIFELMYAEAGPPKADLTGRTLRIRAFFYSDSVAMSEIQSVSLEQNIPYIRIRTNGFSFGSILRGHFRLDELGDGQLYINQYQVPYVVVRKRNGYIIINFKDPERTRRLYRDLMNSWEP